MHPDILLFDEPTSALDPNMVGEVFRVIRNLAARKMTMLIVTHEMRFARDVANRVFYLDEGVLYEEGMPQEIFENPKREKTRQFIRQLRTLSLDIASTDFDYPGLSTEILAFCQLQLLSPALIRNIQLAVEELVLQTILPALGEDAVPMKLSLEYSDADMSTELLLQYGGRAYNSLKEGDELSLRIVKSVAEEWSHEYREQNYLRMRFRQKD